MRSLQMLSTCFCLTGTCWVLPLTHCCLAKSARAYLFPQSVKISYVCRGPISVDPICPRPQVNDTYVMIRVSIHTSIIMIICMIVLLICHITLNISEEVTLLLLSLLVLLLWWLLCTALISLCLGVFFKVVGETLDVQSEPGEGGARVPARAKRQDPYMNAYLSLSIHIYIYIYVHIYIYMCVCIYLYIYI